MSKLKHLLIPAILMTQACGQKKEEPVEYKPSAYRELTIDFADSDAVIKPISAAITYEQGGIGYLKITAENTSSQYHCFSSVSGLSYLDSQGAAFHFEETFLFNSKQYQADGLPHSGCFAPGETLTGVQFVYSRITDPTSISIKEIYSMEMGAVTPDDRVEAVEVTSSGKNTLSITIRNTSDDALALDDLQSVTVYDSEGKAYLHELMEIGNNVIQAGETRTLSENTLWSLPEGATFVYLPTFKSM